MQGRNWSGLPQVRDRPVDPSLQALFVFRLCLDLGSLEGGDLRMELDAKLLQRLMFMGGVFAVGSCLLSIAISPGLLLHLLLCICKHLKDLALVQQRRVGVGSCPLR